MSRHTGRLWAKARVPSGSSVQPLAVELAPPAFLFAFAKSPVGLAAAEGSAVLRGPALILGALLLFAGPVQVNDRGHRLGTPMRNRALYLAPALIRAGWRQPSSGAIIKAQVPSARRVRHGGSCRAQKLELRSIGCRPGRHRSSRRAH